jgi:Big-like domain-containing protein
MRHANFRSVLLAAALLLGACAAPGPAPVSTATAVANPSPSGGYPVGSPVPTLRGDEVPFQFDKPIVAGATTVTGTGPAGVPILLEDVTFMGALMGQTNVGQDGRFSFTVPPLEAAHRLGVTLGDLSGTKWTAEQFYSPGYQGDGAMQTPNVGFFFDTAQVQP